MEDIDQLHAPGKYFVVPTGQEADCSVCWRLYTWKTFLSLPGIEHRYSDRLVRNLVTVLIELA
jgi:hypothetical protein